MFCFGFGLSYFARRLCSSKHVRFPPGDLPGSADMDFFLCSFLSCLVVTSVDGGLLPGSLLVSLTPPPEVLAVTHDAQAQVQMDGPLGGIRKCGNVEELYGT